MQVEYRVRPNTASLFLLRENQKNVNNISHDCPTKLQNFGFADLFHCITTADVEFLCIVPDQPFNYLETNRILQSASRIQTCDPANPGYKDTTFQTERKTSLPGNPPKAEFKRIPFLRNPNRRTGSFFTLRNGCYLKIYR